MFPQKPAPKPSVRSADHGVRLGPLPELMVSFVKQRFGRPLAAHSEAVAAISRNFTSDRNELSPAYLSSPPARAAYLAYYAITGAATVQTAMELAGAWAKLPKERLRVLDLGAGPLSASLGIAALLPPSTKLAVTAIDGVRTAMQDGGQVLATLRPDAELTIEAGNLREGRFLHAAAGGEYDLILFANVLNEWSVGSRKTMTPGALVEDVLSRHLAPGGIALIVEPATRHGSHVVIEAREHLALALGWPILAPCRGASQCPLASSHKDWCFTERSWTRPSHIVAYDAAMGHERATLKFSYLALQRGEAEPSDSKQYRVIGGPMRDAGLLRRYVCGPDGRRVVEVQDHQAPAGLSHAWRGDLVTLNGTPGETNRQGRREPVLQLTDLPPARPRPPEPRKPPRERPRPGFEPNAPQRDESTRPHGPRPSTPRTSTPRTSTPRPAAARPRANGPRASGTPGPRPKKEK